VPTAVCNLYRGTVVVFVAYVYVIDSRCCWQSIILTVDYLGSRWFWQSMLLTIDVLEVDVLVVDALELDVLGAHHFIYLTPNLA
jgi:hypothetical protein